MVIQRSVVTIDLYTMTNFITVRVWLSSLPFYHCRYIANCTIPHPHCCIGKVSKIFWISVKIRGKYSIGGYPKILGNLTPKFFGMKYHCRYWTKCPIPMLLLHTFSMMGDYVDEQNKLLLTLTSVHGQNSQIYLLTLYLI